MAKTVEEIPRPLSNSGEHSQSDLRNPSTAHLNCRRLGERTPTHLGPFTCKYVPPSVAVHVHYTVQSVRNIPSWVMLSRVGLDKPTAWSRKKGLKASHQELRGKGSTVRCKSLFQKKKKPQVISLPSRNPNLNPSRQAEEREGEKESHLLLRTWSNSKAEKRTVFSSERVFLFTTSSHWPVSFQQAQSPDGGHCRSIGAGRLVRPEHKKKACAGSRTWLANVGK